MQAPPDGGRRHPGSGGPRGQRSDGQHRPGARSASTPPGWSGSTGGWPAGSTTGSCPASWSPWPGTGKLVHVGRHGLRDVEDGLPVEDDTRWRIFSMTKPVTSVAAMMLYEEGAFELNDPIAKWLPEFAETRVYVAGSAQKPVTAPADRADPGVAPAHPHVRADLRLPPRPPGRRDVPRDGPRVGHPARRRLRRGLPAVGLGRRWSSSPAASGTTASPPTSSAGSSRCSPASRWTSSSSSGSSPRWACGTPPSACARTTTPTSLARLYLATPGQPGGPSSGHDVQRGVRRGRALQAGVPVRRRRAGVHRG